MSLFDDEIEAELEYGECRVCGCTTDDPCPEGCFWIESDLCSQCAD